MEPTPEPVRPSPLTPRDRLVALGVVIAGLLLLALWVLRPILTGIVLGALVVLIAQRPFRWLLARVGPQRRGLAATLATMAATLLLLVPLGLLIYQASVQIAELVEFATERAEQEGGVMPWLSQLPERLPSWLRRLVSPDLSRFGETVSGWLGRIAKELPAVASMLAKLAMIAFLTIISMFYFFRDGPELVAYARRASPFPPDDTEALLGDIGGICQGIFYGNAVTALVHGVAAGIGYAIFGAPSVVLLGTLTAFASFVPVVGTAIVWAPVMVGLWLTRGWAFGLGMGLWGLVVVGGIDNVLRPLVTKGQAHVHGLAVFGGIFGGLALFGVEGLILGPLVVGLAASGLRRAAARPHAPHGPADPP